MELLHRLRALEPNGPEANPSTAAAVPPPSVNRADARMPDRPSQVEWDRLKSLVRTKIRHDLAPVMASLDRAELEAEIRRALAQIFEREEIRITPVQRRAFIQQVLSDTLGLGALDELLADASISEIMCNRHDEIWIEQHGQLSRSPLSFPDPELYRAVIDRIVSAVGRRIDESSPMVDARLADGSRVNVIIPPLALDGPVLTIRKFPEEALTVQELQRQGVYSEEFVAFLNAAVRSRLSILVSGGTGSGKTTTLNILSSFIPHGERIVTIEDSAELQLQQPHVVRLESRPANAEGRGAVSIRELVRNALRMRPDRIVIGECRAGEALDMLQAMNTGHSGSMTTLHANSNRDALKRLETMVLMAGFEFPMTAIREQIASAIQLLVHVERLASGQRVVTSVAEVHGVETETILIQELMQWRDGALRPTGMRSRFVMASDAGAESNVGDIHGSARDLGRGSESKAHGERWA